MRKSWHQRPCQASSRWTTNADQSNTNVKSPKPYNHVMVNTTWSNEVNQVYDMQVANMQEELHANWHSSGLYPGAHCNLNAFRAACQAIIQSSFG